MQYTYYPGCTLYTKAKELDLAGRAAAEVLGFPLVELPDWACCGATFPLVKDNLMALAGPARILAGARQRGEALVTLCSTCYNVLKRTNHFLQHNPEDRQKINDFIEEDYQGDLKVLHYLEVLRNEVGFDVLRTKVARPLSGLIVTPYYGCMLLRPPKEMDLDDPERPRIFHTALESLGCRVVETPYLTECCGSFLTLSAPLAAAECSYAILRSAIQASAEVLVTTCPLCQFNLDSRQRTIQTIHSDFSGMPVLYFTQLLALALDVPSGMPFLGDHAVDPRPLLASKGLWEAPA